jgi:hypothetical protein
VVVCAPHGAWMPARDGVCLPGFAPQELRSAAAQRVNKGLLAGACSNSVVCGQGSHGWAGEAPRVAAGGGSASGAVIGPPSIHAAAQRVASHI